MSALGQKLPRRLTAIVSALPPKADISQTSRQPGIVETLTDFCRSLQSFREALLKFHPGSVKRFCIYVFDVVQRLRQKLYGDREIEILGERQRNLLIRGAIEVTR